MTFSAEIRRFATVAELATYLKGAARPDWPVDGVRYHNTYKPDKVTWRGEASMRSMMGYYIGKGWTAGPHYYCCVGSGRPEWDGIWQLTPPWLEGVHAGACNSHTFGVENVADWDKDVPNDAEKTLLVGVCAALTEYVGRPLDLGAHRDCMPDRTCPGQYGYAMKGELQTRLAMMLHTTDLPASTRPGALSPYTEFSPILAAPLGDQAGFVAALQRRCTGSPHYTAGSQAEIANAYWLICGAVGVDPWLAAAQMCHETGNLASFWAARPQRNAAGIGCDNADDAHPGDGLPGAFNTQRNRYEHGVSFPTWAQHSVPAHVGRLLAYAVLPDRQTPMQAALVTYALKVRSLPTKYWGVAPQLKDLNGRWAYPGTDYATKIVAVANNLRGPLA